MQYHKQHVWIHGRHWQRGQAVETRYEQVYKFTTIDFSVARWLLSLLPTHPLLTRGTRRRKRGPIISIQHVGESQTVIKPVTAVGCLAYEDVGRCGMMVFTDKRWQQDEHSDNKAAGMPAEHQRINAFDFSRAIEWTESAWGCAWIQWRVIRWYHDCYRWYMGYSGTHVTLWSLCLHTDMLTTRTITKIHLVSKVSMATGRHLMHLGFISFPVFLTSKHAADKLCEQTIIHSIG